MTTALILASWRPDAPAGMERAVIAHAAALRNIGASTVIVTADYTAPETYHGVPIYRLRSLDMAYPCDDATLRGRIDTAAGAITAELGHLFHANDRVTAAVYVDALWGLGRIMPRYPDVRNILAAHVVGHDDDLRQALARKPARVIAPSATVLAQAAARGYHTTGWTVVANTLLSVPAPADPANRERLRVAGPVRVLARLGPEKGVAQLLAAPTGLDRPVHIALAVAPFELADGSQDQLCQTCQRLATATPGVTIRPGMPWHEVPAWLGDAALVVVPSLAETFGLVALEAMAAGTPVIAYDVGNLPALVADGGIIVAHDDGPIGLWRVARQLLHDPVLYRAKSRAAYYRSRDYWPAHIADQLLKVVS